MTHRQIIRAIRVHVVRSGGGDYHDQGTEHWIVGEIATPMSIYPAYRATRSSWGLNVLGTVVVEVESSDGTIGFGVTTGGPPAAWIIKEHLSRFLIGQPVTELERMWDQMYRRHCTMGARGSY